MIRHDPDGLTELQASGGRLILPGVAAAPGATVRVRIRARDVIVATEAPRRLSALNVLPATVTEVGGGTGPMIDLALACGADRLLARVTRRSLAALDLAPGRACFAVIKTAAIGRRDLGA